MTVFILFPFLSGYLSESILEPQGPPSHGATYSCRAEMQEQIEDALVLRGSSGGPDSAKSLTQRQMTQ